MCFVIGFALVALALNVHGNFAHDDVAALQGITSRCFTSLHCRVKTQNSPEMLRIAHTRHRVLWSFFCFAGLVVHCELPESPACTTCEHQVPTRRMISRSPRYWLPQPRPRNAVSSCGRRISWISGISW